MRIRMQTILTGLSPLEDVSVGRKNPLVVLEKKGIIKTKSWFSRIKMN